MNYGVYLSFLWFRKYKLFVHMYNVLAPCYLSCGNGKDSAREIASFLAIN